LSRSAEFSEWEFLIGYPLEQAEDLLKEENVAFQVIWTAAPKHQGSGPPASGSAEDDAYVIAVRSGHPVSLICAVPDWNVD